MSVEKNIGYFLWDTKFTLSYMTKSTHTHVHVSVWRADAAEDIKNLCSYKMRWETTTWGEKRKRWKPRKLWKRIASTRRRWCSVHAVQWFRGEETRFLTRHHSGLKMEQSKWKLHSTRVTVWCDKNIYMCDGKVQRTLIKKHSHKLFNGETRLNGQLATTWASLQSAEVPLLRNDWSSFLKLIWTLRNTLTSPALLQTSLPVSPSELLAAECSCFHQRLAGFSGPLGGAGRERMNFTVHVL